MTSLESYQKIGKKYCCSWTVFTVNRYHITKHSPSNLHYIALLYSNLIGHCYTNRLSAPSFESSAAAQQKTCLPRTGAKKIKLKTKLDTTHTNSARQLPDFARDWSCITWLDAALRGPRQVNSTLVKSKRQTNGIFPKNCLSTSLSSEIYTYVLNFEKWLRFSV